MLTEINFDGLVGPTHNYAGLSYGNVASTSNVGTVARPRVAALQGLAKMRALMNLGLIQGVLPPHERPHIPSLRRLGYSGTDEQILETVARKEPVLLAQVSSASCMWTANAATVAPSSDTADGRVHFTPANLVSMFHRSIEPPTTKRVLRAVFGKGDESRFVVHDPLPSSPAMGDEGAANHTLLYDDRDVDNKPAGVHIFVYGVEATNKAAKRPLKYPARQTLEASRAVARLHQLEETRCIFVQQNPDVIDAGVFHNDVIAVGSGRVLFYHERAFTDERSVLDRLKNVLPCVIPVRVADSDVSVETAVKTYLFNTQLVRTTDGYSLIAPSECHDEPRVRLTSDRIIESSENPIKAVHYMDVRESMRNGGGPACLRLRVPLTADERSSVTKGCILDEAQIGRLESWVRKYYREELRPADLADPNLLTESRAALDELTRVLGIGSVYEFQQ